MKEKPRLEIHLQQFGFVKSDDPVTYLVRLAGLLAIKDQYIALRRDRFGNIPAKPRVVSRGSTANPRSQKSKTLS